MRSGVCLGWDMGQVLGGRFDFLLRRVDPKGLLRLGSFLAAGSLGLSLAVAGCQQRKQVVTVPISSWPGYEYFYLAHRYGLDKANGVEINPTQYPDPQGIVHAYLRGDLLLAQLTTVEAVDICARIPQRCPTVVLILDESRGGDRIAVVKGISSIAGLKGKRVAVSYSTLGPYVLSRALELNGLELGDVQLADIPLAQMPEALKTGIVQAAVFFPPFSDYAARDGVSEVVFDSSAIPEEVFDVLVVDPNYLRSHGDEIRALVRAWGKAHQEAGRDSAKATAVMAAREQVSVKEFRESEEGLVYFPLSKQASMLKPQGVLSKNLRAVKMVQERLGLFPSGSPLPSVTADYLGDPQ